MYVYCADTYCDSCGARIIEELTSEGLAPLDPSDEWSYDSDHFPKWAAEEETDSPDHCAAQGECLEGIDLAEYGLPVPRDGAPELYGAETRIVGAILSDGLTAHGASYLAEALAEEDRTPYQTALMALWREIFAEYIETEQCCEEWPSCECEEC